MRIFPILDNRPAAPRRSIPWAMIAPHEAQAQANHSQTLERLAERGGLCPSEAVAVLQGREWSWALANARSITCDDQLAELVRAWEAANPLTCGRCEALRSRAERLERIIGEARDALGARGNELLVDAVVRVRAAERERCAEELEAHCVLRRAPPSAMPYHDSCPDCRAARIVRAALSPSAEEKP